MSLIVSTTLKRNDHPTRLAQDIANLYDVENIKNKLSDVQLYVGNRTFYCHKFILQLTSEYFAKSDLSRTGKLQGINPDPFSAVLRFMYTGEVRVNSNTVESLLSTADILHVTELKRLCLNFLNDSVNVDCVLVYWHLANKYEQSELALKCCTLVLNEFAKFNSAKKLIEISESMMEDLLRSDNLNVETEAIACDVLLNWLEVHSDAGHQIHPDRLLLFIRWSGITIDYIKTKLTRNEILMCDRACVKLLPRIIAYLQLESGPFEGLHTRHRPSTRFENCLVTVGTDYDTSNRASVRRTSDVLSTSDVVSCTSGVLSTSGTVNTSDVLSTSGVVSCISDVVSTSGTVNNSVSTSGTDNTSGTVSRISLQRKDAVTVLDSLPIRINNESAVGAVNVDTLYVTGAGTAPPYKEVWKLDTNSGWTRCADMDVERQGHCVIALDSTLYVLGGWDADNKILGKISRFNTKKDAWSAAGDLKRAVDSAACVTYKKTIYLFGGEDENLDVVGDVQVYTPGRMTCKLMDKPMPRACAEMRAVIWETSVILLSCETCLIYNFETKLWQERDLYGANVYGFAAALDNMTVFIAGGGKLEKGGDKRKKESDNAEVDDDNDCEPVWTCTDVIKSVPVMDIVQNVHPVVWNRHGSLVRPSVIGTHLLFALPLSKQSSDPLATINNG